ncbi:hypothetical protein BJ742DRAFT_493487 [Cladochytrium replicatum]|nr:hypothetical protein BJ742DRAFT_493487 [Cladochytrium replicatum]
MEENFFSSSRRSSEHAFTGRSVPSDRSSGPSSAPQRWSLTVGSPSNPPLRHRESDLGSEQYVESTVRQSYQQQSIRSAAATGSSALARPLSTPPSQSASPFPIAARTPSVPVSRQHSFSPGPPPIPEGVAFPSDADAGSIGSQHPYVSRTGIVGGMRQMSPNSGGPRTIASPAMGFVSGFGSGDEMYGGSSGVSPISPPELMFMGSGGQYVGSYPYQRSAKKTPSTSSLRGVLMVKNAAIAATQNTASYGSANSMTGSSQGGGPLTGVGPSSVFGVTESMMPSSLEQQPMAIPLGASTRFSPPGTGSQPHPIVGLNQTSSNPNRTSSSSRRSSFTFPIHEFPELMKVPSASSVRGAVATGVLTAGSYSGSSMTGSPRLGVGTSIGQHSLDNTISQRSYESGSSMEFWGLGNQRGGGLMVLENRRVSLDSLQEDSDLRSGMTGLSPPHGFQRDNAESGDSGPGSARGSYGRSGTSSKRQSMLSIEQGIEGNTGGSVGRGGVSSAAIATSPSGSASYLLSGSMTESMLARRTKSKSALTRFQQLRDLNASFAENLLSSVLASEPEQLSPHSQQVPEPSYGTGFVLFGSSQPLAGASNQPSSSIEPSNVAARTAISPTSPLARNEPILCDADSDPSKERTDDSSATATTRILDSEEVETVVLAPRDSVEQRVPSNAAPVSALHLSSVHGSTSSITSSIVSPPSTTSTSSKSTTGIEHDSDVSVRSGAAHGLDQWSPTTERATTTFTVGGETTQEEDPRHTSVGGLVMEPEGTPSRPAAFETNMPVYTALSPPRAVSPERTDDEDDALAAQVIEPPGGIPIEPRPRRRTATDGGIFDMHQHHDEDTIVARKPYVSMSMMVPNAGGRRWGGISGGGLEQREEAEDRDGWGRRRRPLSHHEGFTMMGIGGVRGVNERGVDAGKRERRTSEEGNVAGATGDEDELIFRLSSFDLHGDGSA